MTGQYIIDFLFLFILVIHIFKIRWLQEENKRLWANLKSLLQREKLDRRDIKQLIEKEK